MSFKYHGVAISAARAKLEDCKVRESSIRSQVFDWKVYSNGLAQILNEVGRVLVGNGYAVDALAVLKKKRDLKEPA